MKQVVRRVIDRRGKIKILELPEPRTGPNQVLVQNQHSLISSGTEMGTLKKTPLELVRQTIADPWMRHVVSQTIFSSGVSQTARRVWQEMLMPREIGYSGAGRLLEVGEGVQGLRVGDKVAYAATGHGELVAPAANHLVPIPENLDTRHAAFVTVGGIAIQGLRRAELQFGETVAIYGLGLVGLLSAMIAKAAGCVVIGLDINAVRNQLALDNGIDFALDPRDPAFQRRIMDLTGKHGVDATIVCASSTSKSIVNNSLEITRRQGRVVLVGYVNLQIDTKEFFLREIDLRHSRAYGPGAYHRAYEKGRLDYPFGYVRWTERRNLQEFIRLLTTGAVNVEPLIAGVYRLERVQEAFDAIASGTLGGIAALIEYGEAERGRSLSLNPRTKQEGRTGVSIVGCGNHVLGTRLPHLRALSNVEIRGLVSATGKNASIVADRIDATLSSTDLEAVLEDPGTDAVMICSGHADHAEQIYRSIEAGKSVFAEKPLAMNLADLERIDRLMTDRPVPFALGLNRRYSPRIRTLREFFTGPVDSVKYVITQPYVPPEHWTLDAVDGGGRLVTEGEHFLDLCHFLVGTRPLALWARPLGQPPNDLRELVSFSITVHYENAEANIVFSESGASGFPRERLTVLGRGQVAVLDDFSRLSLFGPTSKSKGSRLRKEMGHEELLSQFIKAVRGEPNKLATWEETTLATLSVLAAQESLRTGSVVDLRDFGSTRLDPTNPPV
ncbi:MAG: bi-domain-containing oxidoreductase [Thermoanaerobaculia bacterium]|nr:bi-domain-containing oxidoreductase [Thermoanaerobaculia bacterium]